MTRVFSDHSMGAMNRRRVFSGSFGPLQPMVSALEAVDPTIQLSPRLLGRHNRAKSQGDKPAPPRLYGVTKAQSPSQSGNNTEFEGYEYPSHGRVSGGCSPEKSKTQPKNSHSKVSGGQSLALLDKPNS